MSVITLIIALTIFSLGHSYVKLNGVTTPVGFPQSRRIGSLPPGYAFIDGDIVDMSNKLIQRMGGGPAGGGTDYYAWTDQTGPPIFRRIEVDFGKRFVIFPDRNFPPGEGHFVVLRKYRHAAGSYGRQMRPKNSAIMHLYEAFYLDLGDSINAVVSNYNGLGIANGALNSLYRSGILPQPTTTIRAKRKIQSNQVELLHLDKIDFNVSSSNINNTFPGTFPINQVDLPSSDTEASESSTDEQFPLVNKTNTLSYAKPTNSSIKS